MVTRFKNLSFRIQLALIISGLVVVITGVAIWRLQVITQEHFIRRFWQNIETTHQVINRGINEQLLILNRATQQMADNPRFLAALSTHDPQTFQDLIMDLNERFDIYFRNQYSVMLYQRQSENINAWMVFDLYGFPRQSQPINTLLNRLEKTFTQHQITQWSGQIMLTNDIDLSVYLISAYYFVEDKTILIFGNPLNNAMAEEVRKISLETDDHLLFIAGNSVISSTLSSSKKLQFENHLKKTGGTLTNDAVLPQGFGEITLGRDRFLCARESIAKAGALPVEVHPDRDVHYLILKSRGPVDEEIMEMKLALLLVGGMGLVFAILLSSLVAQTLALPINRLVNFTTEFSQGHIERRLRLDLFHGEFSTLAHAFDQFQISLFEQNRKLIESERLYRTLIENSSQAISGVWLKTGVIFAPNRSFRQLMKMSETDFTDFTLQKCFFSEDQIVASDILNNVMEKGLVSREIRWRRSDGQTLVIDLRLSKVEHSQEESALLIVTDETEKLRLEKQIIQAQKMDSLGILSGGIAHDFNNILTPILGFASLARTQVDPSHPVFKNLEYIERSALKAKDLLRNLLSFSRTHEFRPQPLNLNQIIEEVHHIICHTFEKNIVSTIELASNLDIILGDSGQIQPMILNLCMNARDAMPTGGALLMKSGNSILTQEECENQADVLPGNFVFFSITDTGFGMDEATLKRIFEPFFTTKPVGKGTGLGLSMVYGIVKSHKGVIKVASEVNKGTTFQIFLPSQKRLVVPPAESSREIRGGSEHILLVDDEANVIALYSASLKNLGYRITTATNGREAWEILQESNQFNLIILDMVMPEMSGRDLLDRLRRNKMALPILICSGYSAGESLHNAMQNWNYGFLQKPFTYEQLSREIRTLLDKQTNLSLPS